MELAPSPVSAMLALFALDAALAAVFVAGGLALNGDQAEMFRELMPGTLLSFAQLLFIAAVAWAIHRRADGEVSWFRSLWGLSAVILLVFAFDEITQSAIFLSHALEDWLGMRPAAGFHDLEAVLLTLLFAAAALVVLPRLPALLKHPQALGAARPGGRRRADLPGARLLRARHALGVRCRGVAQAVRRGAARRRLPDGAARRAASGRYAACARGIRTPIRLTSSQEATTSAPPVSHPASTSIG